MIELAVLIIFGVFAQWIANRLKVPAILPLIFIGLLLGPFSTLVTVDGQKFLEPIWNGEKGLFPGRELFYFVSLAVGVILFEGGLTLRRTEVIRIGSVVLNLITLAVIISFIGSGIAAHYIFDLDWGISFLFASLVVVTGPTVIRPILRHIPLRREVSSVLRWEGILIDPIGAVAAIIVFNLISYSGTHNLTLTAVINLGKILLIGFTLGFTFAQGLAYMIRKNLIPRFLMNIFTLAVVLSVFILADYMAEESGLVAVVVMGMVMGNIDLPNYKEILDFKESLSILLVSILFILLAANIDIEDLLLVYNSKALLLFLLIIFFIRPMGVFLSSIRSPFSFKEKLFISWVGPRGIVAAGVSSLFGIKLKQLGVEGAEYITPLVFMIVLGTVILNATTARWVAKLLGVFLEKSEGILIVGSSKFPRMIASYLQKNDRHVMLIDTNTQNIKRAKDLGLIAFETSIFSDKLNDNLEVADVSYLMALTENDELNKQAINLFKNRFGESGTFRLVSPEEKSNPEYSPKEGLFSHTDDYANIKEVLRKHPEIHEVDLKSQSHYNGIIEISKSNSEMIPLFIKDPEGDLKIIPSNSEDMEIDGDGFQLVYLGESQDSDNKGKIIELDNLQTSGK